MVSTHRQKLEPGNWALNFSWRLQASKLLGVATYYVCRLLSCELHLETQQQNLRLANQERSDAWKEGNATSSQEVTSCC